MTSYHVLISDVRVFKHVIEADDKAAADEAAQALLNSGYSEADGGELVEVRDPSVDDVQENQR
jgi:hypothetical protein